CTAPAAAWPVSDAGQPPLAPASPRDGTDIAARIQAWFIPLPWTGQRLPATRASAASRPEDREDSSSRFCKTVKYQLRRECQPGFARELIFVLTNFHLSAIPLTQLQTVFHVFPTKLSVDVLTGKEPSHAYAIDRGPGCVACRGRAAAGPGAVAAGPTGRG